MLYLTFVLYLTSAEQDPHGVESAHSKIYYLVKVSFNSDSRTEKLTKLSYKRLYSRALMRPEPRTVLCAGAKDM